MTTRTHRRDAERPVRPSLISALAWYVVSYGFSVVGYLAVNAVASRWLGVDGFGAFVAATTAAAGIGQLALLGVHRAGLREAAASGLGPAELRNLRGAAAAAGLVTLPVAAAVSGATVGIVADGSTAQRVTVAVAFAVLVHAGGLQKLCANYLRGFGDVRLSSLLEGRSGGALIGLTQGIVLLGAWALVPESSLAGAMLAAAVGFAVPVVHGWRVTRARWRDLGARGALSGHLVSSVGRSWRFGLNQTGVFLAGAVELWVAYVVLTAHDSSLFSAAFRLSFLLAIPLTAMQVVFAPLTARLLADRELGRLQAVVRTGATIATLGSALVVVPMLLAPELLLELVFGSGFEQAALALMLLTAGQVANVVSGLAGTVLTMSRREGLSAAVQTGTAISRMLVGAAAAWSFGLVGLAVSSAAHSVLMYTLIWHLARSRVGVRTEPTLRPSWRALRAARS